MPSCASSIGAGVEFDQMQMQIQMLSVVDAKMFFKIGHVLCHCHFAKTYFFPSVLKNTKQMHCKMMDSNFRLLNKEVCPPLTCSFNQNSILWKLLKCWLLKPACIHLIFFSFSSCISLATLSRLTENGNILKYLSEISEIFLKYLS